MISYLQGKIKNLNPKSLTILTVSGVGYKVFLSINNLLTLQENQEIELLIHTVVKEDSLDLYGFINLEELEMFEKLISVSGVGPRSALNILSVSSISNLAEVIENNNLSSLPSIPGVGKKSLEKIIIELKGKLSHLIKSNFINGNNKNKNHQNSEEADTRLALNSLGYNEKNITEALNLVKNKQKENFQKLNLNQLIKEALQELK